MAHIKRVNEMAHKSKRRLTYEANKTAKCGETILCPVCGKEFVKRQYSQAFCCGKCKDAFWNARGDRHSDTNYYTKYNMEHPERYAGLIGLGATRDEREYYEAMHAYATDPDFREWLRQSADNFDGDWDSHCVRNTIGQEYQNYLDDRLESDF